MALIDLDKFVASFITEIKKNHMVITYNIPSCIKKALEDQGLEYKDGEIVKSQRRVSAEAKEAGYGESKEERIMEKIIATIHLYYGEPLEDEAKEMIDWLEKQGKQILANSAKTCKDEQKPANKVEPKFKVGDWVRAISSGNIFKILSVNDGLYRVLCYDGVEANYPIEEVEKDLTYWTIQDAKDGDVLASNHSIFIFSQEYIAGKPEAHCGIMNGLFIVKPEGCWTNEKCYPATKEQQDILYQKMNEEGYEWLADKKELKMIEQKPAESRQKTKPNGGIVYEDFNEGDGYYKVNLAYLSKSQVELIENLVASWQNPTNNTVEWSEEDEKNLAQCIEAIDACYKWDSMIDWLKSLRFRSRWKPSEEQMRALHDMNLTGNISYAGQGQVLIELYNDLKKL